MKDLTNSQIRKAWTRKGGYRQDDSYILAPVNGTPWITETYVAMPLIDNPVMFTLLGHLTHDATGGMFDPTTFVCKSDPPNLQETVDAIGETELAEPMTIGQHQLTADAHNGIAALYRTASNEIVAFNVKQLQMINAYGKTLGVQVGHSDRAAIAGHDQAGKPSAIIMPVRVGEIQNRSLDVQALLEQSLTPVNA